MKNYVTLVEEPLIFKDFRFMIMRVKNEELCYFS